MNEGPQAREPEFLEGIAGRLREERVRADLSQRELARRLGLSPSLISQLESGQSRPSVGTLYAIVTELGISLDRLIRGDDEAGPSNDRPPVLRAGRRATIDLDSGVRWEELADEDGVDFLLATYAVGGASTPDTSLIRHQGREYGYILRGTLHVRIGFREYEVGPGDSIAFDSTTPHRLENRGDVPVEAIWLVVGRDADHRADAPPSVGPV